MFTWLRQWQTKYSSISLTGNHLAIVSWSQVTGTAFSPKLTAIIADSRDNRDINYGQPLGFHEAFEKSVYEYAVKRARKYSQGQNFEDIIQIATTKVTLRLDRYDPVRQRSTTFRPVMKREVHSTDYYQEAILLLHYFHIGPLFLEAVAQHKSNEQQTQFIKIRLDTDVYRDKAILDLIRMSSIAEASARRIFDMAVQYDYLFQLVEDWHRLEIQFKGWIGTVVRNTIIDGSGKIAPETEELSENEGNIPSVTHEIAFGNNWLPVLIPYLNFRDREDCLKYLIITLLRAHEWEYPDIASCLGITIAEAYRLQFHGLRGLKGLMEQLRVAFLEEAACPQAIRPSDFIELLSEMDYCQTKYQHKKLIPPSSPPVPWVIFIQKCTLFERNSDNLAFQCNTEYQQLLKAYNDAIQVIMPWDELVICTIQGYCTN